jgi:hypothetical protein
LTGGSTVLCAETALTGTSALAAKEISASRFMVKSPVLDPPSEKAATVLGLS